MIHVRSSKLCVDLPPARLNSETPVHSSHFTGTIVRASTLSMDFRRKPKATPVVQQKHRPCN